MLTKKNRVIFNYQKKKHNKSKNLIQQQKK